MCKQCGAGEIHEIRKATATDDLSAELLVILDKIAQAFAKYFDTQLPKYIAQAESAIIPITSAEDPAYSDLYDTLYAQLAEIFGIWQREQMQFDSREIDDSVFAYKFDIDDVNVQAYINTRTGELIKDVDATTQKQVQEIIANAQSTGMQFDDVAKVIYDKFSQYNEVRSYLIAQQELRTALESGRRSQFEADAKIAGVVGWKRSKSQNDDQVRSSHMIAQEAWWIPANQPFPWVEKMQAPYDFGCRCTNSYRMYHPDQTTQFLPE